MNGPREPSQGLRVTRQRRAVLGAVESLDHFAGAQTVHAVLEAAGHRVGLSTVYRSLHALAEHGAIDAVRGGDGEVRYRRCSAQDHHHVVCRRCGDAAEIPAEPVGGIVRRLAELAGYSEVDHVIQSFGVCARCSTPNSIL